MGNGRCWTRLGGYSAFDLLRFPKRRTKDFVEVIPELGAIEDSVLERVDIDGTLLVFRNLDSS